MNTWSAELESIETTADEWDALADRLRASPFEYPGWFGAWDRAFGGGVEVLTVRHQGNLRALIPIKRSGRRVQSPTNSHTPRFAPLVTTREAEERLTAALFDFKPACLDLCHIRADSTLATGIEREASKRRYASINRSSLNSAYIQTNGDWSDYERGIHRRRSIRQHLRHLRQMGALQLDVRDGTDDLDHLLDEGFRIESSGWKTAYGTAINERPERRTFYAEVARWAARRGWLRLVFLRLDDRTIAFDFSLGSNGAHYVLKTGYDATFAKHGPGSVIRYLTVQQAFLEPAIDLYYLAGTTVGSHNQWKLDWTTHSLTLNRIRAFAPTVPGIFDHSLVEFGALVEHVKASFSKALSPRLTADINQALRIVHRHGRE